MAQSQRQQQSSGREHLPIALAVIGVVSVIVGLLAAFVGGNLISAFIGDSLFQFGLVQLFFIAGGGLFIAVGLLSARPNNRLFAWLLYVLLAIVVAVAVFVLWVLEMA